MSFLEGLGIAAAGAAVGYGDVAYQQLRDESELLKQKTMEKYRAGIRRAETQDARRYQEKIYGRDRSDMLTDEQRQRQQTREDYLFQQNNKRFAPQAAPNLQFMTTADGKLIAVNPKTGQKVPTKWAEGTQFAGEGADPTTNARKRQEMLALGAPDNIATGIAYGTIRKIEDPIEGRTAFVDLRSNEEVGAFEENEEGRRVWVPAGAKTSAADTATTGTNTRDPGMLSRAGSAITEAWRSQPTPQPQQTPAPWQQSGQSEKVIRFGPGDMERLKKMVADESIKQYDAYIAPNGKRYQIPK